MVATFAGSALMGAVVYGKELYNFLKPRRIGVYGPTMVGKTTLDHFMRTPGEMDDIEERNRYVQPRAWVSGESMLYLGRRYVLKVIDDPSQRKVTCKLIGGQLRVQGKAPTTERTQKAVRQWYRDRAIDVFQRRLTMLVETLPWTKTVPDWRMIDMQTQWGSCSPEGAVLLNPHLIKANTRAIDYVLLHELCLLVICQKHALIAIFE